MKQSVSLVITDHAPSSIARSVQVTSASSFETSGGIFTAFGFDKTICSPARDNPVVIWPDGGIDVIQYRPHAANRRRRQAGKTDNWMRRPPSRLPSPALPAMSKRLETRVGTNGNPDIAPPPFVAHSTGTFRTRVDLAASPLFSMADYID